MLSEIESNWPLHCISRSLEEDSIEEIQDIVPSVIQQQVNTAGQSDGAENNQLTKQSCHDSGIDIRDPVLPPVVHAKKNYSDADIVLSSDWVPPITIAPTDVHDTPPRPQSSILGATDNTTTVGRKKTSSVSFSVDENNENQHHHSTSSDKTSDSNKKNKMLKRLSYPLTWVEGLTGEVKSQTESTESAPNTGDSNQSVFSKVFSRYVDIGIYIVLCIAISSVFEDKKKLLKSKT